MKNQDQQKGFSLIELMIAAVIGLLLSYAIMEIYVAQTQTYRTENSQELIQNSENAITNLVTPIIRSAGFIGCASISTVVSNLNGGGSNPLGSLETNPVMLAGYNSNKTSINITQLNPANDSDVSSWTPALDSEFAGRVQSNSDVLVVLGAFPGSFPSSVTSITPGSSSFTVQSTGGISLTNGQIAAISDCVKASIFQITAASSTTIDHATSGGPYGNSSDSLATSYQKGSQFIPLQQNAFFIGQGQGGQSALMQATLSTGTWTIQPLIPGIDVMKVKYGIGANGSVSRYVSANQVTNWGQVYSVRLGFLIEGQAASGNKGSNQYTVLGTSVTMPDDHRLRHVYEMTINLRNATS